jgi:uracil-DNA glycosylase family 4
MRLLTLEDHKRKWSQCFRCPLGARARKRCYYDKSFPRSRRVDILFIGEGPGESEDVIGKPFIGKAGILLRAAIEEADPKRYNVQYGFANLVVCRPQDQRAGKNRQPSSLEVAACSPRLQELLRLLKPRVCVCLGKVPQTYFPDILAGSRHKAFTEFFYHPSYIDRNGGKKSALYPVYVMGFRELFGKYANAD